MSALPFQGQALAKPPAPKVKITAVRPIFVGFVYVKIETDAGVFGIGDGSLGGRDQAVIETTQSHFAPALVAGIQAGSNSSGRTFFEAISG